MLFRSRIRTLFVFIFCSAVWGANIPIKLEGSTETQIVISYKATTSAACTVAATDNNGGPAVNDLDPTKFTNANLDLSRTFVNGFRWPTVVDTQNPLTRTVFIGGHDEVKLGMDARCAGCQSWYSTALQTDSDHTITVQCNSGADIGTLQAKTKNIPLASNYPEQVIPQPQAPLGGYPQPTRRWDLKRQEKIIDPISGMLMIGVEGPLDEFNGGLISAGTFNFAYDVNANSFDCTTHNWNSPCNAFTNQTSGTLASTSTVNAPLFLAPDPAHFTWGSGGYEYLNDFQTLPYGCSGNCNGSGGTVTMASCLSQDSGQTCFTKELDVTVGNGSASPQPPVPSALLTGLFSGWAPFAPNAATGGGDIQNLTFTSVSASGSIVTATPSALFNINRPAGSKFTLSSCASGANVTLTVAHVDSPIQITAQETGLNHSNCTYQDRSFGLRVWLKTPGTLKLSETYTGILGDGVNRGSNGEVSMCSPSKVTDIQVDCDGNTRNPPISGYLCKVDNLNSGMIVLIQDNNRVCLQTSMGKASGLGSINFSPKDWLSNKSIIATRPYDGHVWTVTKDNSGNYAEYAPGMTFPRDRFAYYDVTANGNPVSIRQQIINLGGKPAAALQTGLFGTPAFQETSAGYIWYGYFAGGQNSVCGIAIADSTNTVLGALNGWDTYPLIGGGCHFSPQMFGQYAYFNSGMNQIANYDPAQTLGGPFIMQPTGIRKNGNWTNYTIPITAATNSSPVTLTAAASDLDNWGSLGGGNYTGAFMTCAGGTGSWTGINATFHALRADNNTFSLKTLVNAAVDSSAWGAYPGGVTCSLTQPLISAAVASVSTNASDSNAAQVTIGNPGGFTNYFPSGAHHFKDGDPVVFYNLPQTSQFYVKATCAGGCDGTHFDVFKDAALTQPAKAGAPDNISSATNNPVSYAEACPVLSSLSLPGPILYDKIGGPSTGNTPFIRCVTMEFTGEPCSYWAGAAESTAYPCAPNAQTYTSQLQAIQPGAALFDTSHSGNNHEHFLVLAKDTASNPGKIRLTLMRWYGESADAIWSQVRPNDYYAYNHAPGWTPMTTFVLPTAMVDGSKPTSWIPVSPALSGQHVDVSIGPGTGNITMSGAWQPGTYDGIFNQSPAALSAPLTYAHNSAIVWNGDINDTLTSFGGANGQTYPSCRHEPTAPPSEQIWCGNWAAANVASGNSNNNADGTGVPVTLTPQAGTNYVYAINNPAPSGVTNIKTMEYVALAPAHLYAQDISSPNTGNQISDSTLNTKCYAYKNDECRTGSIAGTWFIAMSGVKASPPPWGQMRTNNMTLGQPVLYPAPPWGGWALQTRIFPIDRNASGVRRLTMGFGVPTTHYSFQSWRPGPPVAKSGGAAATEGIWGFFPNMPFASTQLYQFQTGAGWLLAKVPQWPTQSDNLDRTKFVPTDVTQEISGSPGRKVRIAFGYGENGDPSSLYCTSRHETCWTSATATDSNPFVFASEPQQPSACDTRCAVPIPAIPGRVVFYQIEITDGARKELLPLRAIAIP